MDSPDTLLALARSQHGALTTAQAAALGTGRYELARLVREGVLVHPCRGVYLASSCLDGTVEALHLAFCAGALLLYPDATLTGVSATLAHGLPVWGADLTRPDLHRPVDRGVGARGCRVRPDPVTPGWPDPVTTRLGPADPPAFAVVQLALDHGMLSGVVSADAALHRRSATTADLRAAAAVVATWPRSSRVRAMLEHVDGGSESVGESRLRVDLAVQGIPVDSQVEIRDGHGDLVGRADLVVRGTRVVIEFDGRVKYASGDPAVLWAEKRREDRLRALGYVVVRITWADLETPGLVVAKVRRALAAAAA